MYTITMKRLIAIIIVLLFQYSFSQKYILLDSLTAHYDTKKYTFSTLPYGSENTIELYLVFFKIEKQKEDKCALLDFQQQIFPFDKMRNIYKKRYPNYMFPLDQRPYQSYEISYNPNIPNDLKGIYLSSIEYIEGYKVYYFYKLCNNRGIGRFAYIKGKGVIAGSFDAHFSPWWNLNRDWFNNILSSKEYLWAEELKKEKAKK